PTPADGSAGVGSWPVRAGSVGTWVSRRPLGRGPSLGGGLPLLADAGGLADAVAQVVQLRAADVTAGGHLDLLDGGGVHREGALHADTEGDLADGEGLTDTGTVDADDHALEDLDTAAVALDDLDV